MGILSHWLLILAIISTALVGTVLFYMGYEPSYTSSTRILLEDRKSVLTQLSAVNTSVNQTQAVDAARIISNEVQYLKSLELAKGVDKVVQFNKIAEFAIAVNKDNIDIYSYFEKNIKIAVAENSNVIEISYTAKQPELAARILNAITDVYKKQKINEDVIANEDASNWLAVKVKELQTKQRDADAKVVEYRINNEIFEGQNNQKLLSEQLSALNASIVAVSSQRAETVARADLINRLLARNGNLDSARDVLNSATIQQYRQQAVTLNRSIAESSETLLPSHPRLLALNAELANVQSEIRLEARNIMLSLRNEVEISRQRVGSLKSELKALKNAEAGSLVQEVELNALKLEASSNRILLDSYLAKYREAEVRNKPDLNASQVHVISAATVPLKPSSIGRSAIFAVMAVVGLLVGILIATLRTLNSHSKPQQAVAKKTKGKNKTKFVVGKAKMGKQKAVKKPKVAVIAKPPAEGKIAFADLSFMAAIPLTTTSNRQNNMLKNDILAHLGTDYANSFIDLVDNLMSQSSNDFQKHFMITGIVDEEKSYETILNLARILDMKGARVLIIDLDVESHLFSKSIVETTNFGFSDVINGRCYFEDCIIKDNKSDADILLPGANIVGVDQVIVSNEMEEFLDELDQIYDVILIHSNSVQQQHITAFIDGQIDLTLLVANWEDRATDQLEDALMALKEFQGSDFGLLLMSADMVEFEQEVG